MVFFKLILSGPICVDCKYNYALHSAGVDVSKQGVVLLGRPRHSEPQHAGHVNYEVVVQMEL